MIILRHQTQQQASQLAEKLRAKIEQQTFTTVESLTASFGVTEFSPGDSAETMIKRADIALYRAKDLGRNQVMTE